MSDKIFVINKKVLHMIPPRKSLKENNGQEGRRRALPVYPAICHIE